MSGLERLRVKSEEIKETRAQQLKKEQEITALRGELRRSDAKISKLQRAGLLDTREGRSAQNEHANLETHLTTAVSQLKQIKSSIRQFDAEFGSAASPQDAIKLFSDHIPILLFPVRLEIKFMKEERQLWVRIYPDDIVIETHEPSLTDEELEAGRLYYRQLWRAGKDPSNVETEKRWKDAWSQLAETYGPQRAAWIAKRFIDNEEEIVVDLPRPDDPVEEGDDVQKPRFNEVKLREVIPLRPASWSEAPRARVMPDRFVVLLYRNGNVVYEVEGNAIPHPLVAGPAPYPTEEVSEERLFDAESEWIVDFDKAVEVGMALKIDLTDEDLNKGFSRVVALGVKASADTVASAGHLNELIESHHYTEGFSFIPQGTPTNNTSASKSGFTSQEPAHEASYEVERDKKLIGEDDDDKDGSRVASALGIRRNVFAHIENANGNENEDARHMLEALWPATWGYFLKHMMAKTIEQEFIDAARKHFIEYVRGRGPLSAIRVGDMPYGLLLTTAHSRWEPASLDSNWTEENLRETDRNLNIGLRNLLQSLYTMWREMAEDKQAVPRVGGSDDPERELTQILGMEGGSHTCRVRPVATDLYLWNLLRFLAPTIFSPGWPWGSFGQTSGNWLQTWWEEYEKTKEESQRLLEDLGSPVALPPVLKTAPWGAGYDLDKPLVEEPPLSEHNRLRGTGSEEPTGPVVGTDPPSDYENYIDWLKSPETSMDNIRDTDSGHPSDALLYNLLRHSILLKGSKDWIEGDLEHLSGLATANLERLLTESLDLCTHRLDAWMISLVTKRLDCMRRENGDGIYLGAFGWVEDLEPTENANESGGYIHCSSISQADAAAVLRSAYLTHAEKENADVMAINLTSERVRRSLWLLDGMRQGQPLGALLGYRFERGLHENYPHLELDQYIYAFRNLYPLKAGEEIELGEGEAVEAVAARNVVDGKDLLKAWEDGNIPFHPDNGLPLEDEDDDEYRAIKAELDALDDALDAVGDLGLAESVYQCVQGNYDRAGAILDTMAGGGRPPEPEVVRTPRSGINLKHRLALFFAGPTPALDPLIGWPKTARGSAEPHLDKWAEMMLVRPEDIRCKVWYIEESETVSVKDLSKYQKIGPLDFLYLSSSPVMGEATEIEQRIAYHFRREKNLKKDAKIRIEFKRGDDWSVDKKSFPEILALAKQMRDLIANASFLEPADLYLPEEAEEDEGARFTMGDYRKLKDRVSNEDEDGAKDGLETARRALVDILENRVWDRSLEEIMQDPPLPFEDIRELLLTVSQFGLQGAIPESDRDDDEPAVLKNLLARANSVLNEVDDRLKKCNESLLKAIALEPIDSADKAREGIGHLIESMKALFGKSFTVLPRFLPANSDELKQALDMANTTALLDNENPRCPILWLQQAAQTHPRIKQFETVMMLGETLANGVELKLRVGQLPFKEDDRWLALPFKEDDEEEKQQGTLSLVVYIPGDFEAEKEYAGLVIDEWDEIIPGDTETTAIAYQFNQPGAEAPQVLLLAVSPKLEEQESIWEWDDLVQSVNETLELAKVRAVDLDALRRVGRFLPALYMPTRVGQ